MIKGIHLSSSQVHIRKTENETRGAPLLKINQIVDAKVVKIISPTKSELLIAGEKVIADTSLLLTKGEHIKLKVTGDGDLKVLKLVGSEKQLPPSLTSIVNSLTDKGLFSNLTKILDSLDFFSGKHQGTNVNEAIQSGREGIRQIKDSFDSIPLKPSAGSGEPSAGSGDKAQSSVESKLNSPLSSSHPGREVVQQIKNILSAIPQRSSAEGGNTVYPTVESESNTPFPSSQPEREIIQQIKNIIGTIPQRSTAESGKAVLSTVESGSNSSLSSSHPEGEVIQQIKNILSSIPQRSSAEGGNTVYPTVESESNTPFPSSQPEREIIQQIKNVLSSVSLKLSEKGVNTALLASETESNIPFSSSPPSREEIQQIKQILSSISLKSSGTDKDFFPRLMEQSGLRWESKISGLINNDQGLSGGLDIENIVSKDIKAYCLKLMELHSHEKTDTLSSIRTFVDDVEKFQLLNSQSSESGRYLVPFPVFVDNSFDFGQILFDLGEKESGSGKNKPRIIKLSLLLNMSNLGPIRVDCSVLEKDLSGRIQVGSKEVGILVNKMLPELKERLAGQGFKMMRMDCSVTAPEKLSQVSLLDGLIKNQDQVVNIVI